MSHGFVYLFQMKPCQKGKRRKQNIDDSNTLLPFPHTGWGLPHHLMVVVTQGLHRDHGAIGDNIDVVLLDTATAVNCSADREQLQQGIHEHQSFLRFNRVFCTRTKLGRESLLDVSYNRLQVAQKVLYIYLGLTSIEYDQLACSHNIVVYIVHVQWALYGTFYCSEWLHRG